MTRRIGIVLGFWAAIGLGACATVRPEEKELLADPIMGLEGRPIEAAASQHVLENREGSIGGGSAVAGGCGCN